MGLPKEGIQQAKEALEIYEQLGDTGTGRVFDQTRRLLHSDKQLDAAEEAAFRAIDLLPGKGEQFRVCGSHRVLGDIYQSKGEIKKAIHHFELALGIASSFNWHDQLFWVHYKLAGLFQDEGRLDDAHAHVELAKSHTVDSTYNLGYAMELQAMFGTSRTGLKRRGLRLCARPTFTRSLGLRRMWRRCRKLLQG
jgi:tetratricopeptide (TPR) repeat protein